MPTNLQQSKSLKQLYDLMEDQKLLLPEFQRDYKWPIDKTLVLFDSIFQNLFIGSLIISKPKFDLHCKGFDIRKRGSKGRKPRPIEIKKEEFENRDIYALLDGQQRATSIYRALKGVDDILLILKPNRDLLSEKYYNFKEAKISCTTYEFIHDFSESRKTSEDSLIFTIAELFEYVDQREKKFLDNIVEHQLVGQNLSEDEKEILRDFSVSLLKSFLTDVLKRTNIISVQLLDMDIEKFCLYFERSNSQGLNLSFTDIVTAKIYNTFRLGEEIEIAKVKMSYFEDKLIDPIVRYICFKQYNEVTKKEILKSVTGDDFNQHWSQVISDIDYLQHWLIQNNYVFDIKKLPYISMIIPLLAFFQGLKRRDMSIANQQQIDLIKFWFFASIIENRYGGGAMGSTNATLKEDCLMMKSLSSNIFPNPKYWSKYRLDFNFKDFLNLDGNKSAISIGIQFFLFHKQPFKNLENKSQISFDKNKIDVHHIYPKKYLKRMHGEDSDEYAAQDSILNKIRINKGSNQSIGGDKAPSEYIKNFKNKDITTSLNSHYIPNPKKLINGDFDKSYLQFIKDRYDLIHSVLIELNEGLAILQEGLDEPIWGRHINS